jgi:hypothetical protein
MKRGTTSLLIRIEGSRRHRWELWASGRPLLRVRLRSRGLIPCPVGGIMSRLLSRNAIFAYAGVVVAGAAFPNDPATAGLLRQVQASPERLQTVMGRLCQTEQKQSAELSSPQDKQYGFEQASEGGCGCSAVDRGAESRGGTFQICDLPRAQACRRMAAPFRGKAVIRRSVDPHAVQLYNLVTSFV